VASDLDQELMRAALEEARTAAHWGDVPVGAVVAKDGEIVGKGRNVRERQQDPTGHAEILALRAASETIGRWHLEGCTLYVTLEPCAMCAGAMVLARIDRLVFGATDPKAGFAGSLGDLVRDPRLNHSIEVESGVLAGASGDMLKDFFRERR
jgi:tRNA(Arg) A34 adenosine deaminase TadA